jgi:hypothetical protein
VLPAESDVPLLRAAPVEELRFKVVAEPDSWLTVCYDLLSSQFGPEVLDPLPSYADGLVMDRLGSHPFPFLLMAAYFEDSGKARVAGVVSGSVMRIERRGAKRGGRAAPEFFFAIGNQATSPVLRSAGIKGVGTRLWRRAVAQAGSIAKGLHGRLAYSFLEAENDSVGFWDRMGYRWPKDVSYWQPPLEWDENGDFLHPEVPEIPMLKPLGVADKRAIDRRLLYDIIATVYRNWALAGHREVLSAEAMQRAEAYVMGSLLGRVDTRMPRTPRIPLVRRPHAS